MDKNIIIIIDMQKGFSRYPQTKKLEKDIINLLDRNIFDIVVTTKFKNSDNSMYEQLFNWKHLKTEEEQEISYDIFKYSNEVVEKYIYNCVNANFIQRLCQLNNGVLPKKVFLAGADTDCCVLITATALFENNVRPIVLTKYCHSNGGDASHKAGILCLKRLIGEKQLLDIDPLCKADLN